jgi:acyl-CoA synthetase (AMP-forming)/AMP-acid ligase II
MTESLVDLLENAASGNGAVQFLADKEEPRPFAALWTDADTSARWQAAKLGRGRPVALVLTNTRACAATLLGAWRNGSAVASLPPPARGLAPDAYVRMTTRSCAAADVAALLVDDEHLALVRGLVPVPVYAYSETMQGGLPTPTTTGGELIQFTSGSTGAPKGVRLSLEAVAENTLAIIDAVSAEGDTGFSWLPLSHDLGLIAMFLSGLVAGGAAKGHNKIVIARPESFLTSPTMWLRGCSSMGATITSVPNFALEVAIRSARRAGDLDLSRLRCLVVGAEKVNPRLLEEFAKTYASAGFDERAFCPGYGLAEATVGVTLVRPDEFWRVDGGTGLVSNGRPLRGVSVRIAEPNADGVGTVELQSPSVLSGYLGGKSLELTADGWFTTSDIGMIDDGELFVFGRLDDVIIVGGKNFTATDVEDNVAHPAVRAGRVAAIEAPDGGIAVLVEPASPAAAADELRTACADVRTSVTRAHGVTPSFVGFVPRGSLPRTTSGKLRRFVLRDALADGSLELLASSR